MSLKVKDVMTKDVVFIEKGSRLLEAAHTMIGAHVSSLLVLCDGAPVGIITERDFIKKLDMGQGESENLTKLLVDDLMTSKVITIEPGAELCMANTVMREHNFRKLVVMSEHHLKGIITQTDLSKAVAGLRTPITGAPTVGSIMTTKVLQASGEDKFAKAKKLMASKDIGSIVMVDEDEVTGIFTEYDLVSEFFVNPNKLWNSYLRELVTTPVFCVSSEFDLVFVNKLMLEKGFRRLLVVDKGKFVGIVTQTDVTKHLYDFLEKNKLARVEWASRLKRPKYDYKLSRKGNLVIYEKA